jgi:hypothetical protein
LAEDVSVPVELLVVPAVELPVPAELLVVPAVELVVPVEDAVSLSFTDTYIP